MALFASDSDQFLVFTYRFRRQWNRLPIESQVAVGKVLTKLSRGACRLKRLTDSQFTAPVATQSAILIVKRTARFGVSMFLLAIPLVTTPHG